MSETSPAASTGLQLSVTITADGEAVDTDQLVSVETWWEANRVPRARIVLYDGQPDSGSFPFSDAATFAPGARIAISAGYGPRSAILHQGVVVRHGLRITPNASAQLTVETADPLLKMTLARHSAVVDQGTNAALIAALVAANGGTMGANAAGTAPVEASVQAQVSDWDLMLLRAEASGCLVLVEDGKVEVVSPSAAAASVLTLQYGDSIIGFDGRIDATAQLAADAVSSYAWSYAEQAVVQAGASGGDVPVPGETPSAKLAEVMSVSPYVQQTAAAMDATALGQWSSATLMRARLSQFVGSVKFQGDAVVKPGKTVTLAGLGSRFEGDAFVSAVRHTIRGGDWHSVAELGLATDSLPSRDPKIAAPSAAGLAAPLKGLHTGQVTQVAEDPAGEFRVKVNLPLTDARNGVWARLAQPYASEGVGWSFFPEVGDEVVLGFMNEDPASAVILASVYSGKRAPTHAPENPNDVKALVTRSKMEVNFNDKDVVLKISTPGGRYVELDDKAGAITVADGQGDKLVMTGNAVELISAASLTIKAAADITLDAGANLTIKAAAKCDISGAQVSATGSAQLALASQGVGSLKAAALLEVNGALVKIN